MHGWNMVPGKFTVDGMDGSDFRGKTVGPVYFETACTYVLGRIYVYCTYNLFSRIISRISYM